MSIDKDEKTWLQQLGGSNDKKKDKKKHKVADSDKNELDDDDEDAEKMNTEVAMVMLDCIKDY